MHHIGILFSSLSRRAGRTCRCFPVARVLPWAAATRLDATVKSSIASLVVLASLGLAGPGPAWAQTYTLHLVGSTTLGDKIAIDLAERFLVEGYHATGVQRIELADTHRRVWTGQVVQSVPGPPGGAPQALPREVLVYDQPDDATAKRYLESVGATNMMARDNYNIPQAKIIGYVQPGDNQPQVAVEITVEPRGSIAGFDYLHWLAFARKANPAHFANTEFLSMSSTAIPEYMVQRLRADYGDLRAPEHQHEIARDAVVIVVNTSVPINRLTTDQLHDIFTCRTNDWSRILTRLPKNVSTKIERFVRDSESGTGQAFRDLVLRGDPLCSSLAAPPFPNNEVLTQAVAATDYSIGYASLGTPQSGQYLPLAISHPGLSAVPPHAYTVLNGSYPLARSIYFYSTEQTQGSLVKAFLDFLEAPGYQQTVQTVIRDGGLVPLEVIEKNDSNGGTALSVTFHFDTGIADVNVGALNADAIGAARRLKQHIEQQNTTWDHVTLVGYADTQGDDRPGGREYNCQLSRDRAAAVAAYFLRTFGVTVGHSEGRCSQDPIGSNATPEGMALNRRVEVAEH